MAVKTVQAIINGVTTILTLNSSTGKYEATITAPSKSSYTINDGHYYPVTVKATDVAGNTTTKTDSDTTLGVSLKLKVKEKVAPAITITSPTAGSYITNNKPTIKWKVTDADSGVNPATIGITIDSGSKVTGDMSVLILQLQLWQMAAIQLRSMHLTLMEMRLHRRPLHSRSILYHLHFLSQLRQINWLPTRLRLLLPVLPMTQLPALLQ